jgi:Domain of unknown function (DUF4149)
VIGFLRFIGVINAAVWLGGTLFFTVIARPALGSPDMQALLGAGNFPYFSGAVAQLLLARCFHFQITCAVIAWCHLLAEWLYLGRPVRNFSFSLLAALLVCVLLGGYWLQPRLKRLHNLQYAVNVQPASREFAAKSFRVWHAVSQGVNLLMIGGLIIYVWRAANPSDKLRFVSSVKFRG